MQLNNAPPAPPPAPLPNGSSNQYDFIMNTAHQPKRGLSPKLAGSSNTQRLLIMIIGGSLFIMTAIILFSLVFKSGGGSAAKLTDLAQRQNEIARVADIGVTKAVSPATKNFANTTKLSMISSQQQTIALLKKSGHKVNTKQLGIKMSTVTDDQLTAAAANNSFDDTFTKLLTEELSSYRTAVQAEYKISTSNNEKLLLQDSFKGVTLLIGDQKSS